MEKNTEYKKIIEAIRYAVSSTAFYRDRLGSFFDNPGFDWGEEEAFLRVFEQLPFTQAADLTGSPEAFLCVPQAKVERVVTFSTSGTAGERKKIYFSQQDLDCTLAYFTEGMRQMVRTGDNTGILFPGRGDNGLPDLIQQALEPLGVRAEKFVPADSSEMEQKIQEAGAFCKGKDFLVGLPQDMLQIAEVFPELKPGCVLLSGQMVPRQLKQKLKELWGCEVFEHYGMTETGFGLAVDCREHDMLHLRSDEVYAEVIDPITGQGITDGRPGELVVTTLAARAMPLVRYRTGDLVSMSAPGEKCRCGFGGPMIKKIHGRRDKAPLQPWKKNLFQ